MTTTPTLSSVHFVPQSLHEKPLEMKNVPVLKSTYALDDFSCIDSYTEQTMSDKLHDFLSANNVFETVEEKDHKLEVLSQLRDIVQDWVVRVYSAEGFTRQDALQSGTRLLTFGSYFLDVNHRGSDVDMLILGTNILDRNRDMFGLPHCRTGETTNPNNVLVEILRQHPEVDSLVAVPDAFVPVIKFKYSGVQIDLISGFLATEIIPRELDLVECGSTILSGLDDASQLGINAVRLSHKILSMVPNEEFFRQTLRAVTLWARKRSVYSNILGYLGGVSWTIMTARICMMHPYDEPSVLLLRFFQTYSAWDWPRPVVLPVAENGGLGMQFNHRRQLMPVLTPLYPCLNTTHNVSYSTRKVIVDELIRGYKLIRKCIRNFSEPDVWQPLFEEVNIFRLYKNYLQIDVKSSDAETEAVWRAFIESRLRHLLQSLQRLNLKQVHLFPQDTSSGNSSSHTFYFGIDFHSWKGYQSPPYVEEDVMSVVNQWIHEDLQWKGRDISRMDLSARLIRQGDLLSAMGMYDPSRRHTKRKGRKTMRNRTSSDSLERKKPLDVQNLNLQDREQQRQQITSVGS
mmetsp:Transcript_5326/g.15900  ORF Transcript_5326/g.15900 Transcript_5326/m.15900 type:complete len:571 (-) Transcript_5326:522-2234(-)|eukprot:CAMPEP_0198734816 /NCGR_PEP_ID=MMETSP1475-20131203/55329_1 /TAXON_ID= ORGANISM="Unidentified sp., Strain CCMP1999" /NCGR_SAMPLE_ID=MMETSP1475 /ASSEMBLY_ACC=CAM_ASM_001111 /LENGTH=570 /DNA_ID=CAMNT_0044498363 /DNA_START=272 /DNA_END=1984 /DNA_ORIENTATION=-